MRAAIKALLLGILLVAPAASSAAEKPFSVRVKESSGRIRTPRRDKAERKACRPAAASR